MLCGRLVLQIVKEHDSDWSYERRNASQHAMGSDVGNKNHSQYFCRGLKNEEVMHDVMTATILSVLTTIDSATLRVRVFAVCCSRR